MHKVLKSIIADRAYNFLNEDQAFPIEQKGCKKGSYGCEDKLLSNKMILEHCRKGALMTYREQLLDKLRCMKVKLKKMEIIKKRKNWSSSGIDGLQNYWWKKFKPAQQALYRASRRLKENHSLIPDSFPARCTVMLPKTNELSNITERRPITCLNTSYKIYTGNIGKYMRDHAFNNGI